MAFWAEIKNIAFDEITQRAEEGCDVTGFREKLRNCATYEDYVKLLCELAALVPRPEFPYDEPNEYEKIMELATKELPKLRAPSDDEVYDRIYGAWLGRCAGCALGKPFETYPYMSGKDGEPGWVFVKRWFEEAGKWPISFYAPKISGARQKYGIGVGCPECLAENINTMCSDDDIRYMAIALLVTERYGADFGPLDVGEMWHSRLTQNQVCTAEYVAYKNYAFIKETGASPEDMVEYVRTHHNPYREWIGAEIRIDGYAYAAAGDPMLAAKMAYADASFSHVRNGIYGAMFSAAAIAAALAGASPRECVDAGLAVIPKTSRLYEDITKAVRLAESASTVEELCDGLWREFGHYHPVHTNNNVAAVAASVIWGGGDFEKSIATSVLCGWDTDCNGATVGSIAGALCGASGLPKKWTAPLRDTLYSEVVGFHPIKISECARRSFEVYKKIKAKRQEDN
ncbi:MAG TPA: ADP-ribosylglycohydrolase family protein [Bacillota bacterium]|nr:ADP-ribosylglycohydrolase family protein [Clostridiales bacterium]HPT85695.1 ADP-ribosylglycohydrolase family protein [Bacillota bacterium]